MAHFSRVTFNSDSGILEQFTCRMSTELLLSSVKIVPDLHVSVVWLCLVLKMTFLFPVHDNVISEFALTRRVLFDGAIKSYFNCFPDRNVLKYKGSAFGISLGSLTIQSPKSWYCERDDICIFVFVYHEWDVRKLWWRTVFDTSLWSQFNKQTEENLVWSQKFIRIAFILSIMRW